MDDKAASQLSVHYNTLCQYGILVFDLALTGPLNLKPNLKLEFALFLSHLQYVDLC